jgi:hypothetical protein
MGPGQYHYAIECESVPGISEVCLVYRYLQFQLESGQWLIQRYDVEDGEISTFLLDGKI